MLDLNFPYETVIQALNYLACKEGGQINMMKAIKLIYFADRYHLRKYGELITQDKYFGMKYGPVPSRTKDIASLNSFLDEDVIKYLDEFLDNNEKNEVKSKKNVDMDFLSETELEALNFAVSVFGGKNQFQLAAITHDYPEWKNIEEKLKDEKNVPMNIMDFVDDPKGNQNPCFKLTEDEKIDLREELKEKYTARKILE